MKRSTMYVVAGVALVLAVALGVAIVSAGDVEDALAFGTVSVDGDSLTRFEGGTDNSIGSPAPSLEGITWEEAPISFEPGGDPAVVLFLAHWCPHCQAEVPRLQAWLDANEEPENVRLFSVATSSSKLQPNFPPSDWLQDEGWTAPVMFDDAVGTAAGAYGVASFPFWAVLDGDGNVALRFSGELDDAGIEQLWEFASGL
jgi:thiol-disulfide isomerase/thioredoxin